MKKAITKSGKLNPKPLKRQAGPRAAMPVGLAVRWALADDVLRMLDHEPGALRFEEEGVHQMRTSVRRLRSDLRFFQTDLDQNWSKSLRDELRWLAGALGGVRDLDVLEQRLRSAIAQGIEGVTEANIGPVFEAIEQRRSDARSTLTDVLNSNQYQELRSRTIASARSRLGRTWPLTYRLRSPAGRPVNAASSS